MQHFRLTHPQLDFWVEVRLYRWEKGWVAEADLAGRREVGVGGEPRTSVRRALSVLGERYAAEMAGAPDLTVE
jgi:hypothetical protein